MSRAIELNLIINALKKKLEQAEIELKSLTNNT